MRLDESDFSKAQSKLELEDSSLYKGEGSTLKA